jgi:hypothetical protein
VTGAAYTASPTSFGEGVLFQPLHRPSQLRGPGERGERGEGLGEGRESAVTVPAQALARIVGPDVAVAVNVSLKREREWEPDAVARQVGGIRLHEPDDLRIHGMHGEHRGGSGGGGPLPAPKNRPAQAPQGARLRAGRAPWLRLPPLPIVLILIPLYARPPPPSLARAPTRISPRAQQTPTTITRPNARRPARPPRTPLLLAPAVREWAARVGAFCWTLTCTPRCRRLPARPRSLCTRPILRPRTLRREGKRSRRPRARARRIRLHTRTRTAARRAPRRLARRKGKHVGGRS